MNRLQALHQALDALPGVFDCDCVECARLAGARALLDRLDTVVALLDAMSQDTDGATSWYSGEDLRTVLRVLGAAAGEGGG